MPEAYRVADVRAAESVVMAQVPDGALMARAAGLSIACVRWLEVAGCGYLVPGWWCWRVLETTVVTRSTRPRTWAGAGRR